MTSSHQYSRVFCISRDPSLLRTRQLVLETCCSAVSVGSVEAMRALSAGAAFDCLVLCHSLSSDEFTSALAYARHRWPGIQAIALTTFEVNRDGLPDRSVFGLDGPRALLHTVGGGHRRPDLESAGVLHL